MIKLSCFFLKTCIKNIPKFLHILMFPQKYNFAYPYNTCADNTIHWTKVQPSNLDILIELIVTSYYTNTIRDHTKAIHYKSTDYIYS